MVPKPPLNLVNWLVMQFTKLNIGPAEILTTTGLRSGQEVSNPVAPITIDDVEYLVGAYGVVGWVVNARVNPSATLQKGSRLRKVKLTELSGGSPLVVQQFHAKNPIPRRAMALGANPQPADFVTASDRFPVFRVDGRAESDPCNSPGIG